MEEQLIEMIRDRFDSQDAVLKKISDSLESHAEKDERYWKKIDDQQAQLRLVKAVGSTGIFTSGVLWAWQKFFH